MFNIHCLLFTLRCSVFILFDLPECSANCATCTYDPAKPTTDTLCDVCNSAYYLQTDKTCAGQFCLLDYEKNLSQFILYLRVNFVYATWLLRFLYVEDCF